MGGKYPTVTHSAMCSSCSVSFLSLFLKYVMHALAYASNDCSTKMSFTVSPFSKSRVISIIRFL